MFHEDEVNKMKRKIKLIQSWIINKNRKARMRCVNCAFTNIYVLFTVRVHYSNLKATYVFRDANTLAIRNE